ncbi:MAG TPA: hypothetical protein VHL98_10365 [Microvirga sp.]|jgi:hypothetical protein|nr:hypothetical protein [Microvirga sp.]
MRAVAGAVLAGFLGTAAPAAAQEALLGIYGAWVLETEECSRIFAAENGRVVFGAQGSGPLPAFIINPTSISNNEYLCAVRDFTVRQADVTFTGRCEFGRRTKRQKFAMRELNGRFQIEIDRRFVPVKRCNVADMKDLATVRAERERFERENASAQDKARGLWATSRESCARAFEPDGEGRYRISPALPAGETALIISPRRFVTRGSTCTSQQVVANLQTGREYQANLLCQAEGREFPTTERITILDPDAIERTPASRNPQPQRLVRCTPPDWEKAVAE